MDFEYDIKVLKNGNIFIAWGLKDKDYMLKHYLKGIILD